MVHDIMWTLYKIGAKVTFQIKLSFSYAQVLSDQHKIHECLWHPKETFDYLFVSHNLGDGENYFYIMQ